MKTYHKAVLYAYPALKTVGKDYAEHIANKALLSYNSNLTTEALAEYLATEILRKERLLWLKTTVEQVYDALSEEERELVAVRYFGKKRSAEKYSSESVYFRKQNRVGEKVAAMLLRAGIDEAAYRDYFAELETFRRIERFLKKREEGKRVGKIQLSKESSAS